jgi:hypothetical protein
VSDIEVTAGDVVTIENDYNHIINTSTIDAEVLLDNSALVNVEPHEYYLTSSGIYTGRLDSGYPLWLTEYVSSAISSDSSLDTNPIIDLLKDRLDSAELGISQNYLTLQTTNISLSTLETSVVSRLDDAEAGIISLDTTKVTEAEALAIATSLQESTFGPDANSYITNIVSTYATDNLASASDYDLLVASYNDSYATITHVDEAIVDAEVPNPAWVDDGSQTDPDTSGEPRYIIQARAKSSLAVDANGSVAGFVAASDGTTSSFNIYADQFTVSNGYGATGYIPFSIDTINSKINMTGDVALNGNLLIDGSIWLGGNITANYNWNSGTPTGFGLFSYGDPNSSFEYNVVGGSIYGTELIGSSIRNASNTFTVTSEGVITGASITADDITGGTLNVDVINSGDLTVADSVNLTPSWYAGGTGTYSNSVNVDSDIGTYNLVILDVQSITGSFLAGGEIQVEVYEDSTLIFSRGTTNTVVPFQVNGTIVRTASTVKTYTVKTIVDQASSGAPIEQEGNLSVVTIKK